MSATLDRRRAYVPAPVPQSLRARIRVTVAEAGISKDWHAPMEALLAVTLAESLGLDRRELVQLARHGVRLLTVEPRFHATFHRLRSSMSY